VVSGTIALMLQANPALTPNLIKAILQYTAQKYPGYDPLTQGAGFLNAKGAVTLAKFFAAPSSGYPSSPEWTARLIWGNYQIGGGRITADANAWSTSVTWGAATTLTGQNIDWGVICVLGNCSTGGGTWVRWQTTCLNSTCSNVTWGQGSSENVVWGSTCGGANCSTPWSLGDSGYPIPGDTDGAAVVWGTTDDDPAVVWGTDCTDTSCEPVIWNNP
jgi:hypothetical protein